MKKLLGQANAKVAVASLLLMASAGARAEGVDDIWAAIDLTGTTAKVTAAGVLIIGIAMAFKAVVLGKRTVSKV
ncbi:hypothetical protein [Vibrio coralliirubri]|uniref:hypothetical protein n=1 Tax=Vibrio coralliirubri TaxID=1516159 RepID=UPI0007EEB8BA|nr:hypothetical protein [Vibrio coralliirubri]OBT16571.1 hypothetical protein A9266_18365 [Vibrio tasmaniensis]